tara:strand:+ start:398 stop:748 length:351 start_codon:yes stop_codon:yes gene_type:complete
MEAKELRIGNYVNFEFHKDVGGIEKVGVFLSDIENLIYGGNKSKYYTPIPLTEEWLVKFGFKFLNGYGFPMVGNYLQKEDGTYWYNVNGNFIDIDHVHQLQNLYFALTNEELIIKQ